MRSEEAILSLRQITNGKVHKQASMRAPNRRSEARRGLFQDNIPGESF